MGRLDAALLPRLLRTVLRDDHKGRNRAGLSDLEYRAARIVAGRLALNYPFVSATDRFLAAAQAALDRLTLNDNFLDAFNPNHMGDSGGPMSLLGFVLNQIKLTAQDVLNSELGLKRSHDKREKGPPKGASPGEEPSEARAGHVEALRGPTPRNQVILEESLDILLPPELRADLAGISDVRDYEVDGDRDFVAGDQGARILAPRQDDEDDQPVSPEERLAGWRRSVLKRQRNVLLRLASLFSLDEVDDRDIQALRVLQYLVSLHPRFFPQGEPGILDRDAVAKVAGQFNLPQWANNYPLRLIVRGAKKDVSFKRDLLRLCDELDELEAIYELRDQALTKRERRLRDPTKAWSNRAFHLFQTTKIREALERV